MNAVPSLSEMGDHEPVPPNAFVTTHWTNVLQARDNSSVALESLCSTYRPALVNWLRSRGETVHDAGDLAHSFFQHLLKKDFLRGVVREKGKFRTFLLAALRNFLVDEHRRQHAAKRGGRNSVASLDEVNEDGELVRVPASGATAPDAAFDRAWAESLLAQALRNLEAECNRSGHIRLCLALEPVLFADEGAPAYTGIAAELGMTEAAVKMAALRLRQRLKRLIRDEVFHTVADPSELEEELGYLKSLFAQPSA